MKDASISSPEYHELKSSSKKWLVLFLSFICIEIGILRFIYHKQISQLKELLDENYILESFIESQQPILTTKAQLKQDYESLIQKKAYLKGNTQLPRLLLKEISKSIPEDCCISSIVYKNNTISIQGIAKKWLSLSNFFNKLSEVKTLGSIRLKKTSKELHYLHFEIEFSKPKS